MPRLRAPVDPWADYRGVVLGALAVIGLTICELAARMGVSPKTMSKYISTPGAMSCDTMRKLHRILGIPAEKVRAVIPVW